MANYSDNLPTYIKAHTEEELQKNLRDLAIESGRLIRPLSVYTRGSFVFCWFVLDIKSTRLAKEKNDKVSKKKKVTKKKSN